MASRRFKAGAIIVVIIIVAGFIAWYGTRPPSQTPAEKMILEIDDLPGQGWNGGKNFFSGTMWNNWSSTCEAHYINSTIGVLIGVMVFNSTMDAETVMARSMELSPGYVTLSLGDESFYLQESPSKEVIVFREVNVWAWVQTEPVANPLSWQYNSTVEMTTLQLEKVDRYLAV
jgi:hypothetical protein